MLQKVISMLHVLLLLALSVQCKSLVLQQQYEENHNSEYNHQLSNWGPLNNDENFNYCNSHFAQCGIVKKIQYFPCSYSSAYTFDINLNSACIRCEVCLSIVDQINHTLISLHKRVLPIIQLNETQIELLLNVICEHSFKNFELRNVDGHRLILYHVPNANIIVTNVDGQWEKHLKKRCYDLTEDMGAIKLFKYWKTWWDNANVNEDISRLETILCRDESTFFRDCNSIAHTTRRSSNTIGNKRLKMEIDNLFNVHF